MAITITERCCDRCAHWRDPQPTGLGVCTRYPPVPYPVLSPNGEQIVVSVWPHIHRSKVCGEFRDSLWSGDRQS